MDPKERLRMLGEAGALTFAQRYGRAPLALAMEHLHRFPMRPDSVQPTPGVEASGNPRSREMVMRAAPKSMQLGEFVGCGWTCGYFKNADGLAIIPVWGDLGPMRSWWSWVWYEDLAAAADGAAKDGDVKAILFHIDSPGGHVTGLADCAKAIEAAAAAKPCAAYANDYATSAAYWIAAATGTISAPVTGVVGSIGTLCVHEEMSAALADMGFNVTVVRSDPRKAEANFYEPLSTQALNALQHEVAICADQFKSEIARLRGIDLVAISATQAACIPMDQALTQRFADRAEDFDAACQALRLRAAPALATAAPPAAAPAPAAAKAKPPVRASATRATQTRTPRGAAAQSKPTRASKSEKRRSAMDPTTLPIEEQVARRTAIAEVIAVEPADDNEAAAQFLQIVTIVNAPAEDAEATTEEAPAEGEAAPAAGAKAGEAGKIAASAYAKSHASLALTAIKTGMTLQQFEAAAKSTPKESGGFAARVSAAPGSQPVGGGGDNTNGGDTRAPKAAKELPPAADVFKQRREQQAASRQRK